MAACHECGDTASLAQITPPKFSFAVTLCAGCAERTGRGEKYIIDRGRLVVKAPEVALIAVDMWAVNTVHGPGHSSLWGVYQPNRCIVYRLKDASGESYLAVLNPVRLTGDGLEPVGALHRLEDRLKCKVKILLSPDSLHNLTIKSYAKLFPQALFLYPAGRIDRAIPDLATSVSNAKAFTQSSPEIKSLAEHGLEIHLWRGAAEPKGDRKGRPVGTTEGCLFFHHASKVLVEGSHLSWIGGPIKSSSWLIRFILGLDSSKYKVICFAGTSKLPLWDAALFQQGLDRIVSWDWNFITDLHLAPNELVPRKDLIEQYSKIKLGNTVIGLATEDKTG